MAKKCLVPATNRLNNRVATAISEFFQAGNKKIRAGV